MPGQQWFNTNNNQLNIWSGSAWLVVAGGPGSAGAGGFIDYSINYTTTPKLLSAYPGVAANNIKPEKLLAGGILLKRGLNTIRMVLNFNANIVSGQASLQTWSMAGSQSAPWYYGNVFWFDETDRSTLTWPTAQVAGMHFVVQDWPSTGIGPPIPASYGSFVPANIPNPIFSYPDAVPVWDTVTTGQGAASGSPGFSSGVSGYGGEPNPYGYLMKTIEMFVYQDTTWYPLFNLAMTGTPTTGVTYTGTFKGIIRVQEWF